MTSSFKEFFRTATAGCDPYPYQERFADAEALPHLLRAPTGAGKTAAAVLGWLWRWVSRKPDTPRRLVYCLPMRVLVEQSERTAKEWIKNLKLDIPVHVLMGGVEAEGWYLEPEKPAVLIGTQDMLLSRALNRGYAASRFHWPIDFGLLNNDSLWVFDEPQLMANGVSTSAQLAGLRKALGTFDLCPSVWMSATLESTWLDTVDFRGNFPNEPLELSEEDYSPERGLHKRMTAEKKLVPLSIKLTKEADDKEAKAVAKAILEKHRETPNSQTLVILNTVRRATKTYKALSDILKKPKAESPRLLLVHSRFRPYERERLNEQLQKGGEAAANRIIVATQVVEAGVDISAQTLITELAPWASIVQRIGRCNRTGDDGSGRVFWIDLDTEKLSAPYDAEALNFARDQLKKLDGRNVSPKALDDFKRDEKINLPFEHTHVIRRRDVLDLFDTSPDLSGNDIDVSRYVRGDDPETDVRVFWRRWEGNIPPASLPGPERRELCSVPVGNDFREFLEKLREKKTLFAYAWDHLDDEWKRLDPRQMRPGLTVLLPAEGGGYSSLGWDSSATDPVEPVSAVPGAPEEGTADDPESSGPPLTIADHTTNVCSELNRALKALDELTKDWSVALLRAARWHDAGKAHPVFQASLYRANPALSKEELWAKSGVHVPLRHERKYFRHELASALAALQNQLPFELAYLIAAHHGKVRLSIRSLPGEAPPTDPTVLFAHGIRDGDRLPAVQLGSETCSETVLDLTPMRLGGGASWTARALALRDELGPFRLAYLEAILRAADLRASASERKGRCHA